jgi:DNA-directed RNA polymerase subunit RPC12/RpoP/type 1 fimbria pilin
MSEFKYACPVCGQHIKCDSSQAGTVMECPTCFQKITVPQAPATDDQKLIITGTKVGERPVSTIPENRVVMAPKKKFPMAAVVALLVLACAAGAAVFAFRGKIFKSSVTVAPTNQVASGSEDESTPPRTQTRPRPAPAPLVAPHANDTNWMLNLEAAVIPNSTAAGRIHGRDFIVERAILQNGTLTLRTGRGGTVEFGVMINFGGAQPETLAGQSLNITTNADKAAGVMLRWKDGDHQSKVTITNGYALRLNFGQLSGNHLSGKIYLCAPDETKSYIAGNFNADIRRPKPKQ